MGRVGIRSPGVEIGDLATVTNPYQPPHSQNGRNSRSAWPKWSPTVCWLLGLSSLSGGLLASSMTVLPGSTMELVLRVVEPVFYIAGLGFVTLAMFTRARKAV